MVKTIFHTAVMKGARICAMLMLTCIASPLLSAQCLLPPPAPDCFGTEPLAANGQTITTALSKWFYGSPQTFNNLTLDGGTLIVSGDLTINNLTFNSGVIFVRPGARLTIASGPTLQMQGGCYIYNYGKMILQRGLALDNAHVSVAQPNVFINAGVLSELEMPYDWLVINNPYSWFVNNGKASMHGIVTDPLSAAGSVCLGNKSQIYMTVLINNAGKTYSAPSGPSCVSVSEHAYICETVTNDGTMNACLGPTAVTDSSCLLSHGKTKAWGSAQLFTSCTTCGAIAVLPVLFSSFSASPMGTVNYLKWQVENFPPGSRFEVQRSGDGIQYAPLLLQVNEEAAGAGFFCVDRQPLPGMNYYRIFCEESAAGIRSSKVCLVKSEATTSSPAVYPNPFTNALTIHIPSGEQIVHLSLLDILGETIVQIRPRGNEDSMLVLDDLNIPAGCYMLRIVTRNKVYLQRVVKR